MIDIERGFPDEEFAARLGRAQAMMDARSLDALLVMTEADVRYFSGFLTQFWQSPTRPWFLILPREGKPIAVIPAIGAVAMGRTWVEDIRTWSAPAAADDGVSLLRDTLVEVAGKAGKIGLPKGRETQLRMPLSDFEALEQFNFVDATEITQSLRKVKSPREVQKIRAACQVASRAFDRLPALIGEGVSEREVFKRFKIACLEEGADDVSYLVGGAGQGGYGDIISPPSERPMQKGDVLILDVGLMVDGYFCDFDRNFSIGPAADEVKRAYDIAWRATEAGIAALRPNIRCSELFHIINNILQEGEIGQGDVGRLGHGLGMQLTELFSLTDWDETELPEGTVLTIEPGLTFAPGRMMVHEENLVITDGGAELLTKRAAREIVTL